VVLDRPPPVSYSTPLPPVSQVILGPDTAEEERLELLAGMLGLVRVGVILAHAAREYAFSVNEILLAAKIHAEAVAADPEHGKYFVTMKARPVLEAEKDIEVKCLIDSYPLTPALPQRGKAPPTLALTRRPILSTASTL
jgi:hypothetical protein